MQFKINNQSNNMYIKFKNPATYLISGVTGFGKTKELIKNKNEMFENPPKCILYLYGTWQDSFQEMENKYNVEFHKGLPDQSLLQKYYDEKSHSLILVDDLMSSAAGSNLIMRCITKTHTTVTQVVCFLFKTCLQKISEE